MLILGIDTSCDDTAAAVISNGNSIFSSIISNQNLIHNKYGGIVPELASRRHLEMIFPVVSEAISQANCHVKDISAIAVTTGPGLIGSLLVGLCFAKSIAYVHNIPLVAVNHLEGHIHSIHLEQSVSYPFLSLIVSGGHTSLYRVDGFNMYRELGRTRDDAAGEAYDKVAKLLDLGYPGGPEIERIASSGNPAVIHFPRTEIRASLDFSFSGLKTAVLNYLKKNPSSNKADVAAGFQESILDMLTQRLLEASRHEHIDRIVLSGGVAANNALRQRLASIAKQYSLDIKTPSKGLCTDNAAMIAAAGYFRFMNGELSDLSLNAKAYVPL